MKYLLCIFLVACASPYIRVGTPSHGWEWAKVPQSSVRTLCQLPERANVIACTLITPKGQCTTFSILTEDEAKNSFMRYGKNVWDDEKKHCDGWDHT